MPTKIDLHLVSDSTGETVAYVAKSVMAGFEDIKIREHHWALIRKEWQIDNILEQLTSPCIVMYTMLNNVHSAKLESYCAAKGILAINVLTDISDKIAAYLNTKQVRLPGKQHEVNSNYFLKIDALNYTLHHDDGQNCQNLSDAEIIIVGVSRTSKSPTSIYLAHRGYKCANIPFVKTNQLPAELLSLDNKFIVGLSINPQQLVEVRKQRLSSLGSSINSDYANILKVEEEIEEAKRFFRLKNWPVIDVSNKSIEETAARIIHLYESEK